MYTKSYAGSHIPFLLQREDYNPLKYVSKRTDEELAEMGYTRETFPMTLEEIPASFVYKYIENILYSNRRQDSNSEAAVNNAYKVSALATDNEGVPITEAELQLEETRSSLPNIIKWQEEAPYLVKRLFEYSITFGYHIFSMLISYERIKKSKPNGVVKPMDLLNSPIKLYKMTPNGNISKSEYHTINNPLFREKIKKWLDGGIRDEGFETAMRLLKLTEDMGIDFSKEDPLLYDKEFIEKLTTSYLKNNSEYFGQINCSSLREISNVSLSDAMITLTDYESTRTFESIVADTILKFQISRNPKITSLKDINNSSLVILTIKRMEEVFRSWNRVIPDKRALGLRNGFFLDIHGNYLTYTWKSGRYFGDPSLEFQKVMFHVTGIVVAVNADLYLNFQTAENFLHQLKDYENNLITDPQWEIDNK